MAKTDLNLVVLVGRITKDCGIDEWSFGYLPSGTAKASVSIAVNRSKKDGENWVEEANFFDITIFGKQAEALKPYLVKGQQIAVEGHLKQDRWEKEGQKFSKVCVIADSVQLLGSRSQGQGSASHNQEDKRASDQFRPAPQSQQNFENSFGGESENFPEDIPF